MSKFRISGVPVTEGKKLVKTILVPNKLVNLIAK